MRNDHSEPIVSTNQGPFYIKRCVCGGVHICIGGVSINLSRETAFHLLEKLEETCGELRAEAQGAEGAFSDDTVVKFPIPRYPD